MKYFWRWWFYCMIKRGKICFVYFCMLLHIFMLSLSLFIRWRIHKTHKSPLSWWCDVVESYDEPKKFSSFLSLKTRENERAKSIHTACACLLIMKMKKKQHTKWFNMSSSWLLECVLYVYECWRNYSVACWLNVWMKWKEKCAA